MNNEFRISNLVFVCILVVVSLYLPQQVLAAVFSNNEVVEVDAPVNDDAFLAGERVTVLEAIQDDAYVAGGTLEVKGDIGEDLMAAGNTVTMTSTVGDDAFLAGDRIELTNGSHVGDLFAAGRSVEVREGSQVTGDAYLAGANLTLNGTFHGDVRTMGDTVDVGEHATIAGDLIVRGPTPPTIADGAKIAGAVRHIPMAADKRDSGRSLIARWLRDVITWFIVSLALLYFAPRTSVLVLERVYTATLTSFGIGLVWLIAMMPAVILLILAIVGWPLALILVFLCGLLMVVSVGFLPLIVGTWLQHRFAKQLPLSVPWQQVLLGAVVVVSLHFIPVIGPLVVFILTVATLGVLLRGLKQHA